MAYRTPGIANTASNTSYSSSTHSISNVVESCTNASQYLKTFLFPRYKIIYLNIIEIIIDL